MTRSLQLAGGGVLLIIAALMLTARPGLHAVLLVVGLGLLTAPGPQLLARAEQQGQEGWRLLASTLPGLVFLAPLLSHLADAGSSATGFIWVDFPGYAAHAREIFDRGNGLAFVNAYDPDPSSPAVYVFWLYWIVGALITFIGLDPAVVLVGLGLVGLVATCRATFALAALRTEANARWAGHLILMWGGGALAAAGLVRSIVVGTPGEALLHFDPSDGYWFLNWGRNLIYPTEAVLHALVAGMWWAALTDRRRLAVLLVALLCTTHFHTGLAHGTILACSLLLTSVRDRSALRWGLLAAVLVAGQAAYGLIYLPSFAAARAIFAGFNEAWTVPLATSVFAYAPMAVAAVAARGTVEAPHRRFLLCAFAVSAVLINHELFMAARQPLHFTRGYVWLPLALLAMPRLVAIFRDRTRWPASPRLSAALLVGVLCLDNGVFLLESSRHIANNEGLDQRLSPDERAFFSALEARELKGIVLLPSDRLALQLPAYTHLTGWHGQYHWTPNFDERAKRVHQHFMRARDDALLELVDWVLIPDGIGFEASVPQDWPVELRAHGHALYRRPR